MRLRLALAALVSTAGCNAIFGIDPATVDDDAIDAIDAPEVDADGDAPPPIDADGDAPPPIDAPDAPPTDVDAADGRPIDAATPGDLDSDGVLDGADNCPTVYNRYQDNDDGDARGDVCDLCPMRADAAGPAINQDGDELADDCGDVAAQSPQCIAWFDGFSYDRTISNYYSPGGHGVWFFQGGALRQNDYTVLEGFVHLIDRTFAQAIVVTRGTVIARNNAIGPVDPWELGVWSHVAMPDAFTPDGHAGFANQPRSAPGSRAGIRRRLAAQSDVTTYGDAGDALLPGASVVVGLDARGSPQTGALSFDFGMTYVTATSGAPLLPPGFVGLRTRSLSVDFGFLMVLVPRPTSGCPARTEPP